MKKVLMIATVPSMIGQFNMNNINILIELGYEVHVACDWNDKSVWSEGKIYDLIKSLEKINVSCIQIDYSRSPLNLMGHIKSYKQTMDIMKKNNYSFIHCHTPIASAIVRLVCKRTGTKCVYTAHGFHFYQGAPLRNWIIFYPIEKWLSRYTEVLITINMEDYDRAKEKFHMKILEYVPGVGINIDLIQNIKVDKGKLRQELNIPKQNKIIISIGELSKRKNHSLVIKSLKGIQNVTYIICGQGVLYNYLKKLAVKNNVDLRLLGFRSDRIELLKISDLFIFPSLQEGLPVALMEALACKIICVVSNIRGNTDLIKDSKLLFNANKKDQCRLSITEVLNNYKRNYQNISMKHYDEKEINKLIRKIYQSI